MNTNDGPASRATFAAAQAEIDAAYSEEVRVATIGQIAALQRQAADVAETAAALLDHPAAVYACLLGPAAAGLAGDVRAAERAARRLAERIRAAWLAKPGAVWSEEPRPRRPRFVELHVPADSPRAFGEEPPDPAA